LKRRGDWTAVSSVRLVRGRSATFISNAAIFGKVYFPRLSVPLSQVIFSMIKFAIQFALVLAFLIFYRAQGARVQPTAAIALTPLLLLQEVCDELQLRELL